MVDLSHMRRILSVDAEGLTVTVAAGVTWKQLNRHLARPGLGLRLHPTSYPSCTVGGWLAQGGTGIGSYQYGYFHENVVSARVVLPGGEVRELGGEALSAVAYAEGITGIISKVTLRVEPAMDVRVMALSCATPAALQSLVEDLIAPDLPIWSMMFINPLMAQLKNKAPVKAHGSNESGPVLLPEAFTVSPAFRAADEERFRGELGAIAGAHEAQMLHDQIAEHEWEERFNLMLVKRLGPLLVPAEVIVPLAGLADVLSEIEETVGQPIVKEGVILRHGAQGDPEAVILGFIPSDERKLTYRFVFGLSLSVVEIAERHGWACLRDRPLLRQAGR